MRLSDILYENEYTSRHSARDVIFSRIACDTAELERGVIFVCIEGTHLDAHALSPLAVAAEASAIIAKEGKTLSLLESFPVFYVKNTRETLAHLCNLLAAFFIGTLGHCNRSRANLLQHRRKLCRALRHDRNHGSCRRCGYRRLLCADGRICGYILP